MSRVPRASWQLTPLLLQLLHLLHSGMGESSISQPTQMSVGQSATHQATGRGVNPYLPPMHSPPPPFHGTRYHPPASPGYHGSYYPSPAPSAYHDEPSPTPTCSAAHYHSPPAPDYGSPAPAYGSSPPAYGSSPPAYESSPPAYGSPAPAYGSPAPSYGSSPPSYGSSPPSYGSSPPSYGSSPPAYGSSPPAYGSSPPSYGSSPPSYGSSPPSYGSSPPSYGSSPPSYGSSPPSHGSSPPSYGSSPPSYGSSAPSYSSGYHHPPAYPTYPSHGGPSPSPYHYGSMPAYRASSGEPAPAPAPASPETGAAAGPSQGPQMRLMTPSGLPSNMLNPFGLPSMVRAAAVPATPASAPVIVPVQLTAHQAARLAEDLSSGAHVVPMGPMVSISHAAAQRLAQDTVPQGEAGSEVASGARAAIFHTGLGGIMTPHLGLGMGALGHGHAFGLFREAGPAEAPAEQQGAVPAPEGEAEEEAEPGKARAAGGLLVPPKLGLVGSAAHAGVGAGLVKAGPALVGVGGHRLGHVGVGKGVAGASALGKVGALGLVRRPHFGLLRAAGEEAEAEGAKERAYGPAYEHAPAAYMPPAYGPPAYAPPAPAPYAHPAPPAAPCYADYATSYESVPIYQLPLYASPSYSEHSYQPPATY